MLEEDTLKGETSLKKHMKVYIDWNVVSRVIPRDACVESYGKFIMVRAFYLLSKKTAVHNVLYRFKPKKLHGIVTWHCSSCDHILQSHWLMTKMQHHLEDNDLEDIGKYFNV